LNGKADTDSARLATNLERIRIREVVSERFSATARPRHSETDGVERCAIRSWSAGELLCGGSRSRLRTTVYRKAAFCSAYL